MKRKIISSILIIIMLLSGGIPALAETVNIAPGKVLIEDGNHTEAYLIVNGQARIMHYASYKYINERGETREIPAFCVHPTLHGVSSAGNYYVTGEELYNDPKVNGILAYGYPHQTLESLGLNDKYEGYYATKIALWCYLNGWDINTARVNPAWSDQAAAARVLAAAKYAYQYGMTWTKTQKQDLKAIAMSAKAIEDAVDSNYYSQVFKVTSSTWPDGLKFDVRFTNPAEIPTGTKIVDPYTNQEKSVFTFEVKPGTFEGYFKVLYPKSAIQGETGTVTFTINSYTKTYEAFYGKYPVDSEGNTVTYNGNPVQQYLLDTDPNKDVAIQATGTFAPGTLAEQDCGLLIVKKEEGKNKFLPGAIFEVREVNGKVIGTFTTNDDGEIFIPFDDNCTLEVTEISPPENYLLSAQTKQIVKIEREKISTVTFNNKPFGDLYIQKVDADTGVGLSGAIIKIRGISSGFETTATTESGGAAVLENLKPGGYEVFEVQSPQGYILNTEKQTVNVQHGKMATVTIADTAKPGLQILKIDAESKLPLSDTVFEVYRDTVLLGEYITNEQGEITLYDLTPGVYLVKEVQAKAGYVINTVPQEIEVKKGIAKLIFMNSEKPGIHIQKLDSITMEPLANAVFKIKKVGGTEELEFITDQNGEINLTDLDPGAYTVTEIRSTEGYLIDDNMRIIQINAGENAQFVFTNTPKPKINIVKFDSNEGKFLPGATFRISRIEDASHYLDRITDINGQITIEGLEPGIYSVREVAAPGGYVLDNEEYHVQLFPGKTSTLVINNEAKPDLLIIKTDASTGKRLEGVTFTINKVDSSTLTTLTTNANGEILIKALDPGVYSIKETAVPIGYLIDSVPKLITLEPNKTGVVQFANYPKPELVINKIDSVTKKPIKGAKFEIWYASNKSFTGELNYLGIYYSDQNGHIMIDRLQDGWYRVTELEPAKGYRMKEPLTQEFFVKAGEAKTVTFENIPFSGVLIKKIDADTKQGIYGVTFLLYDEKRNPIGQYVSDQDGYVYIKDELTAGKYYLRELDPAEGYLPDEQLKTIYIEPGKTTEIVWENKAEKGQIQITKKSEDDNPINGFPAGTLLSGATFEIYNRVGNKVDTVVTDKNGWAASKPLPIGRYTVKETIAPAYYSVNGNVIDAELEFVGQIVRLEVLNKSVYTNVSVQKRGYTEVVPGQFIKYDFKNIANNATVSLDSFYWRDTLPTDAVRLDKVITGTWNARLSYKVVYKTNISGDYRTLADNLQTSKNYTLNASAVALGLASNEFVTEYMFVFGTVPAGFAQVEAPYIYCKVLNWLPHEYRFVNKTDVGGLWGNQWVMANDRWVTVIFSKPQILPRTGY